MGCWEERVEMGSSPMGAAPKKTDEMEERSYFWRRDSFFIMVIMMGGTR